MASHSTVYKSISLSFTVTVYELHHASHAAELSYRVSILV